MNPNTVPHLRIVVGFCIAALVGYAVFSAYVVISLKDPALTGDVVGTWKSFAVGVFAFWVGSSSGGKSRGSSTDDPQPVTVQNKPGVPIVVEDKGSA